MSSSSPFSPANHDAVSVGGLHDNLPNYEVLDLLGRGGMGAVYKARQKSLKRLVAIKVLSPLLTDDELKFAERFKNEAQTVAQFSHPGIVHVYDFGQTSDGLLYFVMEFVDGTDIAAMLAKDGPLPITQAVEIAKAVCDALHYAHSRGVIHRDIKPANVLIDQEGHVKVADFGLAKMNDPSQASGLTRTNVAMGTQEFAAPEMLTPGAAVDHRADLYSLGVMLYQMLTGEVPRVMFKLPSRCIPDLGTRFDALICKALETEPADRFQSAAELKQALTAQTVRDVPNEHERPALVQRPRSKTMVVVSALAALLLVIFGRWLFFGDKSNHPLISAANQPPSSDAQVIKLWDTLQKVQKEKAVRWENGALVLGDENDKGMLNWAQPRSRDAIFRAEVRLNPDSEYAQMRLRYNWTEGLGDFYRLQLYGGLVDLSVSEHGRGHEIKSWPLPHAYGPDDWARLELRAVGDALTVSLDGHEIETIHDSTLTGPGSVMIVANKNGWFRNVEYVPLDKPVAAAHSEKSINLLSLVEVNRDAINSTWSVTPQGEIRSQRARKAGRLEFLYAPPEEYDFEIDFTVEEGDSGYVMQVLAVPGHWLDWRLLPPPAFGPALDGIEPGNSPRSEGIGQLFRLKPGDRHQSVVEVRKNSLRALVDGVEIARFTGDLKRLSDPVGVFKLRDTGHLGVGVLDIGLLLHKATVREVSGAATAPVESFRPLFDGKSLDGWIALNGASPPDGWRVVDGAITGKPFSAVLTREEFGDFDLRLEWRVNPQGNGGVFYRVAEDGMIDHPLHAVEFNLMDENIAAPPLKLCGAAFGVKAPAEKAAHPVGEWNTARLLVQGTKVEQWINEKLVCSYDLADASVRDGLETAKIGSGFANVKKGRIALQDWSGEAFYRNVRIRELR